MNIHKWNIIWVDYNIAHTFIWCNNNLLKNKKKKETILIGKKKKKNENYSLSKGKIIHILLCHIMLFYLRH